MNVIEQLKARLVELSEAGKAIQAKADAEKRELSVDEQKELDSILNEFDLVETDIKRRQQIEAMDARLSTPVPRQVDPSPVNYVSPRPVPQAPTAVSPNDGLRNTRLPTLEERQRYGFTSMGDFCMSVKNAVLNPGNTDQRLIQNAAASTYGNEGVGADGGFAVPPEWRGQIMQAVEGEDSLLPRCDTQTVGGNTMTFPTDESTAWQTSGGIQTYWDGEAATMTQSKPALKDVTIKLHRLTALVPMTEELLEDSSAMGGYVTRKAGEKFAFKLTDAIVNGNGVGQPLGILNAPCTVQVSKETSQTAGTFHADNAVKMMARMPASSFGRAVWLVNQDVVPDILRLGFVVKSASGTAVGGGALYLPPSGLPNSSPYGSLLGRPIIVTEACQTVGTVGDVLLADLSQYLALVKGGLKTDTSIHLWFDQNITAFRFVMRMNGQPWLSAPIARKNGSNTLSHFVRLETR